MIKLTRKPALVSTIVAVCVVIALSISISQSNLLTNSKEDNNNKTLNNSFSLDLSSKIKKDEDNNTKTIIIDVDTIPEREGYIFLGYAQEANATEPQYTYNSETNTFNPSSITINAPEEGFAANITLYAVWEATTIKDIADATYLQDMNADVCNSMTLDQQYTLIDKRDNKTYTVARLKMNEDGTQTQCWMTQNLALVLNGTELTSEDTDLNSAWGGVVDDDGTLKWTPERNTVTTLNKTTFPNDNNNPYSYNPNNTSYGIYYNWTAAIASNDSSSLTSLYSIAPNSICPKGWRLPQTYGGSSSNRPNEFGNLLYAYSINENIWLEDGRNASWATNGYTKIQQAPINISPTGNVNSGWVNYSGVGGYYWSSSVYSAACAYSLSFYSTWVTPQSKGSSRVNGFAVRCILR